MSKATNQFVVAYVRQHNANSFRVVNAVWGDMARSLKGDSDDDQARKQACKQSNTQALLVVYDLQGFDRFNRIGHMAFYDCTKGAAISAHSFSLYRRGEDKDFGYQTDLRRTLSEFTQTLPLQ